MKEGTSMENSGIKKPSVLDTVLNALKDIFAPNLIALSGAGILQGIVIFCRRQELFIAIQLKISS